MKYLFFVLLLAVSQTVLSQDFDYLKKIRLEKDSDYKKNKFHVIQATDYLLTTPVDDKNMNRLLCNRFLLIYGTGTPYVTLTIEDYVSEISDKNQDVMILYIALWMKSAINHPDEKVEFHEKYIMDELYKYIKAGNNVKRTKIISAMIKAGDENKLDKWLTEMKASL